MPVGHVGRIANSDSLSGERFAICIHALVDAEHDAFPDPQLDRSASVRGRRPCDEIVLSIVLSNGIGGRQGDAKQQRRKQAARPACVAQRFHFGPPEACRVAATASSRSGRLHRTEAR